MSKSASIAMAVLVAFPVSGPLNGGGSPSAKHGVAPCDETAARNVGMLYYATNPVFEQTRSQDLVAFVRSNSQLLEANGPTIQCARIAGSRLVQRGLAAFSPRGYDDAYASALNMGANMDQARSVASSVNSGSLDAVMMGQELLWLAQVVPAAAQGNWGPFNNTGSMSRSNIRQVWPFYQQMMAMDPSMRAILDEVLGQVQPWAEYQVAVLVYWIGN
jgi:hypothetical protein